MEMDYHKIILGYDKNDDDLEDFDEDNIENCIICLPILQNGKQQEQNVHHSLYYVIDDK